MEVKEMLAEKRVKRTAVDMSKLKADGLMVAAAFRLIYTWIGTAKILKQATC